MIFLYYFIGAFVTCGVLYSIYDKEANSVHASESKSAWEVIVVGTLLWPMTWLVLTFTVPIIIVRLIKGEGERRK